MILSGELSRKRIKNATQATKIGKTEICQVLKIEGKYIDLSLKQVDTEDKASALEKYKKNKIAYQILEKASKVLKLSIIDLYDTKIKQHLKEYKSMYNLFAEIKENPALFDENDVVYSPIKEIIKTQYEAQSFKVRADFDLMCDKYNGVMIINKV